MNYHLSLINNVWAGKDQYISQDVEQTNCLLDTLCESPEIYEGKIGLQFFEMWW